MRSSIWNKVGLVTSLAVLLTTCDVFAGGGRGGYSYHGGGHGGHYSGSGWFGLGLFATALTVGAVVASLPREHEVVVVNGYPYYIWRHSGRCRCSSYVKIIFMQCPHRLRRGTQMRISQPELAVMECRG